jgi:hypothetical protein
VALEVQIGREVIAKAPVGVEDYSVTVVIHVLDYRCGEIPLLPAGQLAQSRLACIEESIVLAAG